MKNKITYKLSNKVVNPKYVGLIRTIMPEKYEIEDYISIPDKIDAICKYFFSSDTSLEQMELLDCSTQNDIHTIRFDTLKLDDRQMLYFFFCVQCEVEIDAVFTIESHAIQRLWLNGKMICLCGHGKRQIHTLHLSAGNNVFCFQQHDAIPAISTTFRIRSLDVDKKDNISLTDGNLYYQEGLIGIRVKHLDEYGYNNKYYRFVLFPIDCVNLSDDLKIRMQIIDHISGNIMYEQNCQFHEFYSISTDEFKYPGENIFNYLDIRFFYCTTNGAEKELCTKMYLTPPEGFVDPVQKRAKALMNGNISHEEFLYLEYVLSFKNEQNDIDTFHRWERIEKVISVIEQGEYYNYLRSEGEKVVCFHSDIDDTVDYYTITLPKNYDIKRKYPLLVINNVLQGSWLSSLFSRVKTVEVIAVDFSGRGVTMGSYTGDASFNEIYRDVFSKYNIDETKVIAIGHSNGGYSTWAQAQVTPDRYSAIYPAASEPNHNLLMNLSNISVRYLTSESEYLNSKVTLELEKQAKEYISDYKTLWVEKYNHGLFGIIQFSEKIIDELLQKTNNGYPNTIHFTTNKNRYLKAYWIKIHSIEFGKICASLHANIKNNEIVITAKNITGVTVTIPPQIDKNSGIITLNDHHFNIAGKNTVKLIKNGTDYSLCDEEVKGNIFKGTGIIDPFITPVRIINFLDEQYNEILKNFCSPSTNGFYGGVCVNYPVMDNESLDEFPSQSLVVLDNCTGKGRVIDNVKKTVKIKTDELGYSYQGKYHRGDYLVMQIVEHPVNPENSILYINTNNIELYKKCFFTRKTVLPAYSNGYHPYLNAEALIYDGKSYFIVPEYKCSIEAI